MSNKDTSTLQSYVDSASGAIQSAFGAVTGNTQDRAQGENKKAVADAKDDASHAGATIGGYSVSASGVAANDPNRQQGSWNQTVGSGKEFIGGLVGAEGLKQEGIQQNQEGKGQEAQGQLSDLGKGVTDRIGGTVGGAVAGLTGDREEQAKRQAQHDQGKTMQRGVEADVQSQAEKEQQTRQ